MQIVIQGNPIAKARPRFSTHGGFPRTYDSQAKLVKSMRSALVVQVKGMGLTPDQKKAYWSSPVALSLSFHCSIPVSASKPIQNAKLWGLDSHTQFDLDNGIKFFGDLLNGVVWQDDRQVQVIHATKQYSKNPCTIINITCIKTDMDDNTKKIIKLFSPDDLHHIYCQVSLLANALGRLDSADQDDKAHYLQDAASELIKFSTEFVPKLKKLVKKE